MVILDSILAVVDSDIHDLEDMYPITLPLHGYISSDFSAYSTGGITIPEWWYPMTPNYIFTTGYLGSDSFKIRVTDGIDADTIMLHINSIAPPSCSNIISTLVGQPDPTDFPNDPDYIPTLPFSNGVQANTGDGGPSTAASCFATSSVKTDASGNIYFNDWGAIRKISTSGIITTIAGTGTPGNSGDGGPATAADIDAVKFAIDGTGNIYFTQVDLRASLRKIDTFGIISTIDTGIGAAGFASDAAGNLYYSYGY